MYLVPRRVLLPGKSGWSGVEESLDSGLLGIELFGDPDSVQQIDELEGLAVLTRLRPEAVVQDVCGSAGKFLHCLQMTM